MEIPISISWNSEWHEDETEDVSFWPSTFDFIPMSGSSFSPADEGIKHADGIKIFMHPRVN